MAAKSFDDRFIIKNGGIEKKQLERMPNLVSQLSLIAFVMFIFMSVYEISKQYLFPNISLWESHIITIIFTTLIATIVSYFVLRKFHIVYKNIKIEIEHRKQVEADLRSSEERFKDLVEMLPEVVFETDQNLELTFANRRAFELFGYSDEDLHRGLNGLEMLAPEDRARAKANIALRLKGEDPGTAEYQALKKDGSPFPVLFHASSIMKEGELYGLRGIIVDITDRRRTEQERIQREKLQGIIEMAGAVCHEMNQPMQVVSLTSELLNIDSNNNPLLNENLTKIKDQIDRMSAITQKLMGITRYETKDYLKGKIIDIDKAAEIN